MIDICIVAGDGSGEVGAPQASMHQGNSHSTATRRLISSGVLEELLGLAILEFSHLPTRQVQRAEVGLKRMQGHHLEATAAGNENAQVKAVRTIMPQDPDAQYKSQENCFRRFGEHAHKRP